MPVAQAQEKSENQAKVSHILVFGVIAVGVVLLILKIFGEDPTVTPTRDLGPRPTLTPSCPTPAEQRYFDSLEPLFLDMGDTSEALSAVMSEGADNPSLFFSPAWKDEMKVELLNYEAGAEAIIELTDRAVPSVSSVSTRAIRVASLVLDAVRSYEVGVDNFDPDAIAAGNSYIDSAAEETDRMGDALRSFCG